MIFVFQNYVFSNIPKHSLNLKFKQIVPPTPIDPILADGNYVLNKCVVQKTQEFGNGMYMLDFNKEHSMTLSKFKDHIAKNHVSINGNIEDLFWKDILQRNTNAPIYAIDNKKSLYPDNWLYWRINSLSQNQSIIHQEDAELEGMNTSYLNYGMRFTSFAAHHEDSNLGSMNILHGGDVKTWYGVASKHALQFEQLINGSKPENIEKSRNHAAD